MFKDYKDLSEYAVKYETWTMRQMIVKADDDLRQEVLAIQLMKRVM